jgi:hypothetical protein
MYVRGYLQGSKNGRVVTIVFIVSSSGVVKFLATLTLTRIIQSLYNTIQYKYFLFPIKEPFRAEQLTKNLMTETW